MNKFLAFAALASIAAAPAIAETFTRDGLTYDYTATTVGDATIIAGKVVSNGERFRLKVKAGRVVGQMGSRQVSFRTGQAATAATLDTVLAAN